MKKKKVKVILITCAGAERLADIAAADCCAAAAAAAMEAALREPYAADGL